jgi:lysophospholipase L1-like esterase
MRAKRAIATGVLSTALLLGAGPGIGSAAPATPASARPAAHRATRQWIDAWGASFLSTTVNGAVQSVPTFNDQTYRLNLYSKLGGNQVRVKLSNKFATNALTVGTAHIALRSTSNSIQPATDRTLTFAGMAGVTLAAGAETWSDPVKLAVAQHVTVAVSIYVPGTFTATTFHPTGLHTSYISQAGDFTGAPTLPLASFPNTTTQVLMVSGVQVFARVKSKLAVTLGDSITDGACAANDANGTWPDVLSARLPKLASGSPFGVINMGIGSNRLASADLAGPSGVHRFADDVLARTNVGYVIVMEGINDISYEHAAASTITDADAQLISQAHAAGLTIYGATLLPIGNSTKYTVANEATRQAVNSWIRTSGLFDGVLDFEAVVVDPATNPPRIRSHLTCDFVHPNAAGYAAIGNSIPLALFS